MKCPKWGEALRKNLAHTEQARETLYKIVHELLGRVEALEAAPNPAPPAEKTVDFETDYLCTYAEEICAVEDAAAKFPDSDVCHRVLKALLGRLKREYEDGKREYEQRKREYEDRKRGKTNH